MTITGPLYAFILLNAALVMVTWVITVTHLTSWFGNYFYPRKEEIRNEWRGMLDLERFAERFSLQPPSWACCSHMNDITNDEKMEKSMLELRTAGIVRCVAGGVALLVAPAFSALLLGHVGLV
jgi:hypothetical protein